MKIKKEDLIIFDEAVGNEEFLSEEINMETFSDSAVRTFKDNTVVSVDGLRHIEESLELVESICGFDDRQRVDTTLHPYRFICRLLITAQDGSRYLGSGFFISPRCVITSGHCVHFSTDADFSFNWARSIQVIPGADGTNAPFGSQIATVFKSVKGWTEQRNSNFDHGAIILPDNTLFDRIGGFFKVDELKFNEMLTNSGYPGDKVGHEAGTLWSTQGSVSYINEFKIAYMLDTHGGNSGSPVYIMKDGEAVVVGVHGYGNCPNKCIRVRKEVYDQWTEWVKL